MKQPKSILLLALAATVVFGSCRKDIVPSNSTQEELTTCANPPTPPPAPPIVYCGTTNTVTLIADGVNVGSITVGNNATSLYVTYNLINGYKVYKTRLYVGTLAGIPISYNGNVNTSNFPYKTTHSPYLASFTYTIPLSSLPNENGCNVVAAYAQVRKTNSWGWLTFDETGWGQGTLINTAPGCSNGGMYFNWCNATCEEAPPEK